MRGALYQKWIVLYLGAIMTRHVLIIEDEMVIALELEALLGIHVDLLTPADLSPKFRAQVLAEAQPV